MKQYIPDYSNVTSRINYRLIREAQSTNFRELTNIIREIPDERKIYRNYGAIFSKVMKFKKGIKDTGIKHPGASYYRQKVYLDGQHLIEKNKEKISDKIYSAKIRIDELDFFL